ncbi:MAG: hypothetical protein Q9162_003894 [Coniocarpon cinnabarinum]
MADGLRAIRLTELIQDFRTLQHEISDITSMPPDVNEEGAGHELLLQCRMEGHALLQQPFQEVPLPTNNDPEEEKRHLQFVVLDAAARRFRAQQILLRAEAARRWISSRDAVLNQQQQGPASPSQMEQVDNALSNELANITHESILTQLRTADLTSHRWVEEDPSVVDIEGWLSRSHT